MHRVVVRSSRAEREEAVSNLIAFAGRLIEVADPKVVAIVPYRDGGGSTQSTSSAWWGPRTCFSFCHHERWCPRPLRVFSVRRPVGYRGGSALPPMTSGTTHVPSPRSSHRILTSSRQWPGGDCRALSLSLNWKWSSRSATAAIGRFRRPSGGLPSGRRSYGSCAHRGTSDLVTSTSAAICGKGEVCFTFYSGWRGRCNAGRRGWRWRGGDTGRGQRIRTGRHGPAAPGSNGRSRRHSRQSP